MRTLALLLNFLVGQNLNYREVTGLRHIPFLGESVSSGVGVSNPCVLVGQLGLLLMLAFVADAAITVWRRGERRKALATGGSFLLFALAGVVDSVLVFERIVDWPLTASFSFLGIVVTMGYEMSREMLRAAKLSEDLSESEERLTLAAEAAGVGIWMWSIARDQVWGSEIWLRLFGFAPNPAVTALDKGDFVPAEKLFRDLLAKSADNAIAHEGLVRALIGQDKVDEAAKDAEAWAAARPGSSMALTALGDVRLRQGDPREAFVQFQKAAHADLCNARAFYGLAEVDGVGWTLRVRQAADRTCVCAAPDRRRHQRGVD